MMRSEKHTTQCRSAESKRKLLDSFTQSRQKEMLVRQKERMLVAKLRQERDACSKAD